MFKEIFSKTIVNVLVFIITATIIILLILVGIEYGLPYIKSYLARKFAEILPF